MVNCGNVHCGLIFRGRELLMVVEVPRLLELSRGLTLFDEGAGERLCCRHGRWCFARWALEHRLEHKVA